MSPELTRRRILAGTAAAAIGGYALTGSAAAEVDGDGEFSINPNYDSDGAFESNSGRLSSLTLDNVSVAADWDGFDYAASEAVWTLDATLDGETKNLFTVGKGLGEDSYEGSTGDISVESDDLDGGDGETLDLIEAFSQEAFEVVSGATISADSDGYDENQSNKDNGLPHVEIVDVSDGDVELAFHNPTNYRYTFNVQVDDADGGPVDEMHDVDASGIISDGPLGGETWGNDYDTYTFVGPDSESATFSPANTLKVAVNRGTEQDNYVPWLNIDFENAYDQGDEEDFGVEFTLDLSVFDTEGNEFTDSETNNSNLTIENEAAAVDVSGNATVNATDSTPPPQAE